MKGEKSPQVSAMPVLFAGIILIGVVLPSLGVVAIMIFIPYVVIVPRILENKGIISSDWRRGDSDGTSGGGSGGG